MKTRRKREKKGESERVCVLDVTARGIVLKGKKGKKSKGKKV